MKIELSIDNNFINLCNLDVSLNRSTKKILNDEWKKVERFIEKSTFNGKNNLTVSLMIDDEIIFNKTKMKYKGIRYHNVFHFLENFLRDKIYFYRKLKEDERTEQLKEEFFNNQMNLYVISQLNREMTR